MKITEMLLTPNKYSRPQIALKSVKKVVLHYIGNPNTSAIANRNYFENQKSGGRYVSSNYIVGLDGEIILCVPENEVAYCSNSANTYSISIECCHPDASGKFTDATLNSAAELCAYLLKKYKLTIDDLIRHYDVTGKQCPLWYVPTKYQTKSVANARWAGFKAMVSQKMGVDIEPKNEDAPFKVRIIDRNLNVRKNAGLNSSVVGVIRDGGVFTIVETKKVASSEWGRLKSGIGWINISGKYCERIG